MKKNIFLIITLLLTCSLMFSQSINITSPAEGITLKKGSTVPINWTATGTTKGFKITLWKCGKIKQAEEKKVEESTSCSNFYLIGVINANIPPGNGARSYPWVVGDYIGGSVSYGNYKIKIKEKTTSVSAIQSNYFSISTPYIYLIKPNGGEFEYGINEEIEWHSNLTSNPFKITLWKNNVLVGILNNNFPAGNGKKIFKWKVGDYNGGAIKYGDGFKIKVKEKGTAVSDSSNKSFKIINKEEPFTPYKFEVYKPEKNSYNCSADRLIIKWRNILPHPFKYVYPLKKKYRKKKELKLQTYVKIEIKSVPCLKTNITKLRELYKKKKLNPSLIAKLIKFPYHIFIPKWKTIVSKAPDTGQYNWNIPSDYKKGCYIVRVIKLPAKEYMEKVRNLHSAVSKTFHIVPCKVLERVVKKTK